jgi:hypothetical protein
MPSASPCTPEVSAFLAWIRSPCLRHCVHGASIGGGGGGGGAPHRLPPSSGSSAAGSSSAGEEGGSSSSSGRLVSQSGSLLGRRGRSLPANASGLDTHRDSISSRLDCSSTPPWRKSGCPRRSWSCCSSATRCRCVLPKKRPDTALRGGGTRRVAVTAVGGGWGV